MKQLRGGLSLYSSNMNCGAPFHSTWKDGYVPPNNCNSRPNMNSYTFIQDGGMNTTGNIEDQDNPIEDSDNPRYYPMRPEHFFNQSQAAEYLTNPEKRAQLLNQLNENDDPENDFLDFLEIVDGYLEQHDPDLPKRVYNYPFGNDVRIEVDGGDRRVILNEIRDGFINDVLKPYFMTNP